MIRSDKGCHTWRHHGDSWYSFWVSSWSSALTITWHIHQKVVVLTCFIAAYIDCSQTRLRITTNLHDESLTNPLYIKRAINQTSDIFLTPKNPLHSHWMTRNDEASLAMCILCIDKKSRSTFGPHLFEGLYSLAQQCQHVCIILRYTEAAGAWKPIIARNNDTPPSVRFNASRRSFMVIHKNPFISLSAYHHSKHDTTSSARFDALERPNKIAASIHKIGNHDHRQCALRLVAPTR